MGANTKSNGLLIDAMRSSRVLRKVGWLVSPVMLCKVGRLVSPRVSWEDGRLECPKILVANISGITTKLLHSLTLKLLVVGWCVGKTQTNKLSKLAWVSQLTIITYTISEFVEGSVYFQMFAIPQIFTMWHFKFELSRWVNARLTEKMKFHSLSPSIPLGLEVLLHPLGRHLWENQSER